MIDFRRYQVLSFDCYGTLIDWESGILAAIKPVMGAHDLSPSDSQVLELYAEIESEVERGDFVKYREVLRRVMGELGLRLGFKPSPVEMDRLLDSLKDWMPFPDTVEALQALGKRFKLAIISNVDDDLFALSARHLGVKFDYVITAEETMSYKPSLRNFKLAIERIGVGSEKILHIAQSMYHDIIPARAAGLATVWVNRRKGSGGFGATLPARGQPDLEVPDLKTLAAMAL